MSNENGGAEKWGQQYRCGCFLGFPTKRGIPAYCPQHSRAKQGGAWPLGQFPKDKPAGSASLHP